VLSGIDCVVRRHVVISEAHPVALQRHGAVSGRLSWALEDAQSVPLRVRRRLVDQRKERKNRTHVPSSDTNDRPRADDLGNPL